MTEIQLKVCELYLINQQWSLLIDFLNNEIYNGILTVLEIDLTEKEFIFKIEPLDKHKQVKVHIREGNDIHKNLTVLNTLNLYL
jgi:hypothetical protein